MSGQKSDIRQKLLDRLPRHGVGAEIGVHLGDFSARLMESLSPRLLHLIDPWQYEPGEAYRNAWYGGMLEDGQRQMDERYAAVLSRFAGPVAAGQVVVHRQSSDEALAALPDESLDWVYIDGNHRYDYVKADLHNSLAKMRPQGVITGDDYNADGWWQNGVIDAVDEFCAEHGYQLELIGHQFILHRS